MRSQYLDPHYCEIAIQGNRNTKILVASPAGILGHGLVKLDSLIYLFMIIRQIYATYHQFKDPRESWPDWLVESLYCDLAIRIPVISSRNKDLCIVILQYGSLYCDHNMNPCIVTLQ